MGEKTGSGLPTISVFGLTFISQIDRLFYIFSRLASRLYLSSVKSLAKLLESKPLQQTASLWVLFVSL